MNHEIRADMAASVWKVLTAEGEHIQADDVLLILESMKMEIPVTAERDGIVVSIDVKEGMTIREGDCLLTMSAN